MCWYRNSIELVEVAGVGKTISAIHLAEVLTGKTRGDARKLLKDKLNSTAENTGSKAKAVLHREHDVPGFYKPTWVVTYEEAVQMLDILPDKYTDDIKAYIRRVFQMVEAGDQRVHVMVDANAQNTGVRHELARDGLQGQQVAVVEPEDRVRKRRREDQERLREDQEINDMQLNNMRKAMELMKQLNKGVLQPRDEICFSDAVRNIMFPSQQKRLTNGELPETALVTISNEYRLMGYPCPAAKETLCAIGRLAAQAYRDANGGKDTTDTAQEAVGGGTREVKAYMGQAGRDLVQAAIRTYMSMSAEDAHELRAVQAARKKEEQKKKRVEDAADKKAEKEKEKAAEQARTQWSLTAIFSKQK